MIEIRVRESENKIIDLGKLELIPYDANFDVYDFSTNKKMTLFLTMSLLVIQHQKIFLDLLCAEV